jgi:type I restriction enzyme M protein
MFYTVTLPATLWFFDKAKQDEHILFIDARNIFTQIDRAHREFSEEQIRDIAIINRLHKGDQGSFTALIHRYFAEGFQRLKENRESLQAVSKTVTDFLKSYNGDDIPDFGIVLAGADTLDMAFRQYSKDIDPASVAEANVKQRALNETVSPFFASLHELLREIDRKVRHIEKEQGNSKDLKTLKTELEKLHKKVKETEYFFTHVSWLQERFPEAQYEDVTGLCKRASPDEVKEQEYSLNPGRYVGVVIEEDGKTEEEFIGEMLAMNTELEKLNAEVQELEAVIRKNILLISGEE